MKPSPAGTPRTSLRFLAVSVMFCASLVNIFALEEKLARKLREEDRVYEGTEVGEKQSKLYRDRRTVKNNATPNLSDFANRLKDLEERYDLNSAIRCLISSATFSITWAMFNVGYVPLSLTQTSLKMVDLLTSFTVFTKPQQERTYDDQTISSVGEKV